MRGMKDELAALLVLLASVLDVRGFFISQDLATKVESDETFMVVCRDDVEGLPITWHNPKGLVLGPKTRPRVDAGSYGTSIVFSKPHRVEDTGNYTCSTKKESRKFQLFVEAALKFTDTAANQTGEENSDFVLKCEVTGGTISWAVEGGAVIEQNSKFRIIGDGLAIRNVSRHDSKTYICKGVQQRTGTVLDRKIHFTVKHKPVHPSHPQKHRRQDIIYGYINGTVNLTCLAVANPPATFEWKVKDKKAKTGHIINESPEVSILQLYIDKKSVFENYSCTAKNKYGTYEEKFTLEEGKKPLPPAALQIQEVRSKELLLMIKEPEATPDFQTKGFSVQFRKAAAQGWNRAEFNLTKSRIYTLEDLEPNTAYELQAATRNAAGLSDYFAPIQWTTSGAAPAFLGSSLYSVGAFLILDLAFW